MSSASLWSSRQHSDTAALTRTGNSASFRQVVTPYTPSWMLWLFLKSNPVPAPEYFPNTQQAVALLKPTGL